MRQSAPETPRFPPGLLTGSVCDPQAAAGPSGRRLVRSAAQHGCNDGAEKIAGLMQAIVEGGVGDVGDSGHVRPGCSLPQRKPARTPGQRKMQEGLDALDPAPPDESFRRTG